MAENLTPPVKSKRSVVWAVLLSGLLGPGAGQLYNREWRKGILLLTTGLLVTLAFFGKIGQGMVQRLGPNMALEDPARVAQAARDTLAALPGYVTSFQGLTLALWLYGIVDAYWGAQEK